MNNQQAQATFNKLHDNAFDIFVNGIKENSSISKIAGQISLMLTTDGYVSDFDQAATLSTYFVKGFVRAFNS
jgi:hypothetical protein